MNTKSSNRSTFSAAVFFLVSLILFLALVATRPSYGPAEAKLVAENNITELRVRNEHYGTKALLYLEGEVRGGKPFSYGDYDVQPEFYFDEASRELHIKVSVFSKETPLPRFAIAEAKAVVPEVKF